VSQSALTALHLEPESACAPNADDPTMSVARKGVNRNELSAPMGHRPGRRVIGVQRLIEIGEQIDDYSSPPRVTHTPPTLSRTAWPAVESRPGRSRSIGTPARLVTPPS